MVAETWPEVMNDKKLNRARVIVSTVAIGAAIGHMLQPKAFIPDAITAGLLLLGALPWLSSIIKSIEVTGIGKLELLEQQQASLQREMDALRFLVSGFVNDYEITHLQNLAKEGPFDYNQGATRNDRFINEIIRLRDFGLVKKLVDHALWDIPMQGDLKKYVVLTDRGRAYLALRTEMSESVSKSASVP